MGRLLVLQHVFTVHPVSTPKENRASAVNSQWALHSTCHSTQPHPLPLHRPSPLPASRLGGPDLVRGRRHHGRHGDRLVRAKTGRAPERPPGSPWTGRGRRVIPHHLAFGDRSLGGVELKCDETGCRLG